MHALDVALAHLPPQTGMRSSSTGRLVRTVGAIVGVTEIEELITVRRPSPS